MKSVSLRVLWLNSTIAFCLDQLVKDRSVPLTEFYFWPQKDAWEIIKSYVDGLNWVSSEEEIILLNQLTEIINYWQSCKDSNLSDVNAARNFFPGVTFVGSD